MTDIRKWMKVVNEQLQPTVINPFEKQDTYNKHDTVLISPELGGGIGQFQSSDGNGTSSVDVKGIHMDLPTDKLSLSRADGTDPLMQPTNNTKHINVLKDMPDLLSGWPDPKSGDLVRVDNVYGTGIGPGFGVFMSYSTNGQDAIISFDDTIITIPVEQMSSVVEQEASDEFEKTGNDGAMSPMSLGTNNRVTIGDNQMDHKDEFAKWMDTVDKADGAPLEIPMGELEIDKGCECGNWDCPACFPDDEVEVELAAEPEACPSCGHDLHADSCNQEINDVDFDQDDTEFDFGNRDAMMILADEYSDDDYDSDVQDTESPFNDVGDPVTANGGQLQGPGRAPDAPPSIADAGEDVAELIGKIQYMQDMGLSASDKHYDVEALMNIRDPNVIKRICDKVTGNIHENKESYGDEIVSKKIREDAECNTGDSLNAAMSELGDKFKAGHMSEEDVLAKVKDLLKSDQGDDSEETAEFEFSLDDVAEDAAEESVDAPASSALSGIEQKIAIAKAALARKASGIEEEEPAPDHDHGLRSLGNKIVNAKLKHSGKDASVLPITDDVEDNSPDQEVMEWVKRFAEKDKFLSDSNRRTEHKPVAEHTKTPVAATEVVKEHKGADPEMLDWVARFKKLDNR